MCEQCLQDSFLRNGRHHARVSLSWGCSVSHILAMSVRMFWVLVCEWIWRWVQWKCCGQLVRNIQYNIINISSFSPCKMTGYTWHTAHVKWTRSYCTNTLQPRRTNYANKIRAHYPSNIGAQPITSIVFHWRNLLKPLAAPFSLFSSWSSIFIKQLPTIAW